MSKPRWSVQGISERPGVYLFKDGEIAAWPGGNVYSNGETCWGDNPIPLSPRECWTAFWESSFNSDLVELPERAVIGFREWREGLGRDVPVPAQLDPPHPKYQEAARRLVEHGDALNIMSMFAKLHPDSRIAAYEAKMTRISDKADSMRNKLARRIEEIRAQIDRYASLPYLTMRTPDGETVTHRVLNKIQARYIDVDSHVSRAYEPKGTVTRLRQKVDDLLNKRRMLAARRMTLKSDYDSILANLSSYVRNWENYYHRRYSTYPEKVRLSEYAKSHRAWVQQLVSLPTSFFGTFYYGEAAECVLELCGTHRLTTRSIARHLARVNTVNIPAFLESVYRRYREDQRSKVFENLWKKGVWRDMAVYFNGKQQIFGNEQVPEVYEHTFGLIEVSRVSELECHLSIRGLFSILSGCGTHHPPTPPQLCPDCGSDDHHWADEDTMLECDECGTYFEHEPPPRRRDLTTLFLPLWELPDGSLLTQHKDRYFRGVPGTTRHSNINHIPYIWGELEKEEETDEDS